MVVAVRLVLRLLLPVAVLLDAPAGRRPADVEGSVKADAQIRGSIAASTIAVSAAGSRAR